MPAHTALAVPRPFAARRSFAAAVLAAAMLVVAAILLPALPAHAHDELVSSDPAADSTVETLPAAITLTFSATIATDPGASEVQVTDAAGTSLVAGEPSAAENVLTQELEGTASGLITVLWKVVSSDGHPISGEFSFTATAAPEPTPTVEPTPTATVEPTPTVSAEPTPTEEPLPGPPMGAVDMTPWLIGGLILLVLVGGAVTYLIVSRRRRDRDLEASRPDSTPPADR